MAQTESVPVCEEGQFSFYLDNTINCFCIIRTNLQSVVETVVYFDGIRLGRNVTGRRGVEKEACV